MARKRCVPVNFFENPDVMNLSKREYQLILIGLVLIADDEGRGLAHPSSVGRHINYPPKVIEAALQDLVNNDLIELYQVGKHRYYHLTVWNKWQTIHPSRMIPSQYPAPPVQEPQHVASEVQQNVSNMQEVSGGVQQNASNMQEVSGESTAQVNLSQFNISEGEGEEKEIPANVTPFPVPTHTDDTTADVQAQVQGTTKELALILKLPVSQSLTRLVTAYIGNPTVSLLTEADAAREWIEDQRRNRTGKPMSVHFFHSWVKREHNEAQDRQAQRHQKATGTEGTTSPPVTETSRPVKTSNTGYRSLMGLEEDYRTQAQKGKS